MTTLNNIESFLKIEIGERRLRDGKKYNKKNKYYYFENLYYIVELTKGMWTILEDCNKTRKLLKTYCWRYHPNGYAQTHINKKSNKTYHQLFLNYEQGLVADHINNKKFDNRIENLRIVTYKDNSRNTTKHTNNTSGKQGVSKHTKNGLTYWYVQIYDNNNKRIQKLFSIKKFGNERGIQTSSR
jgi:hypothetical protein